MKTEQRNAETYQKRAQPSHFGAESTKTFKRLMFLPSDILCIDCNRMNDLLITLILPQFLFFISVVYSPHEMRINKLWREIFPLWLIFYIMLCLAFRRLSIIRNRMYHLT